MVFVGADVVGLEVIGADVVGLDVGSLVGANVGSILYITIKTLPTVKYIGVYNISYHQLDSMMVVLVIRMVTE